MLLFNYLDTLPKLYCVTTLASQNEISPNILGNFNQYQKGILNLRRELVLHMGPQKVSERNSVSSKPEMVIERVQPKQETNFAISHVQQRPRTKTRDELKSKTPMRKPAIQITSTATESKDYH